MRFKLTNFDYFDDGFVTSTFEVEAPSAEVGERLIKKQLSKLMRNYPAGALLMTPVEQAPINLPGWQGGYITVPNIQPGWTPNIGNGWAPQNGHNAIGGWQGQTAEGINISLPEGSTYTTAGYSSPMASGGLVTNCVLTSLQPGESIVINAQNALGQNIPIESYTITNSSSSSMSITSGGN